MPEEYTWEQLGMSEEEARQWIEAFKEEHGYAPQNDPELRAKGLSKSEALLEHVRAKKWGEEWKRANPDKELTHDVYRSEQPTRRYEVGYDPITGRSIYAYAGGFGGYPPERIEALMREYARRGRSGGGDRRIPSPYPGVGLYLSAPRPRNTRLGSMRIPSPDRRY